MTFPTALLVFAGSVSLFFSPVQKIIPVGEEFKITVNVSSGNNETLGTDAVITFDPKILSATKIKAGKIYPFSPSTLVDIDNVHGKVSFSGTVGGLGIPKVVEGILGEVFFKAKQSGTTQIGFDWESNSTTGSHIVPQNERIDLLTEKPAGIEISFRPASTGEKIWFFIKSIFSFNYLNF